MTNAEMVRQFHEAIGEKIKTRPEFPGRTICNARMDFIHEETNELQQAINDVDMVAVADALADLLYFTYGTAIVFGIPINRIFEEVHRSNMTKFKNGPTFREDGKLLKGDGFEPPRIAQILKETKL
jgi:predicted HAD superfamily Cof-like phosphohydrolase